MLTLLAWILAFVIAITVHETAHAYAADKLGDPTPRIMGRMTLNPLAHYDPVGTTILLVTAIFTALGFFPFPFGWAKPVQFDPFNLKNPQRDAAIISLAGPGSNLLLAGILAIVGRFALSPFSPLFFLITFIPPIIVLNVVLAIFNLVPIHPLDGGKILVGLLPKKDSYKVDQFLKRYGFIMLFFLIFPAFGNTSPIFMVLTPVINFFLRLFLPGNILS